eukprot:3848894-Rhodomonas_salina.1
MGRTCPPATRVGPRWSRHPSGRCDHPTSYPALTLTVVRPLVCQPCRSIQTPSSAPGASLGARHSFPHSGVIGVNRCPTVPHGRMKVNVRISGALLA